MTNQVFFMIITIIIVSLLRPNHRRALIMSRPYHSKSSGLEEMYTDGKSVFTSVPDGVVPAESTLRFLRGPMAARAVRLASLCLIWASSCCCIWRRQNTRCCHSNPSAFNLLLCAEGKVLQTSTSESWKIWDTRTCLQLRCSEISKTKTLTRHNLPSHKLFSIWFKKKAYLKKKA